MATTGRFTEVLVKCRVCKREYSLTIKLADYRKWQQGALIQDVMPYLTPSERELLISRTCGPCFHDMFKGVD